MNDYALTINDLVITRDAEGCRLTAYPDPGTGGAPWTCGWGTTGPDVRPGTVWTQAYADFRLMQGVSKAAARVRAAVKIELTREEFIALTDFTYNVGAGNFEHSTLLAKLNAGDIEGAAHEFLKWDKAAGHVLGGLLKRRHAEMAEFLLGANFTVGVTQ